MTSPSIEDLPHRGTGKTEWIRSRSLANEKTSVFRDDTIDSQYQIRSRVRYGDNVGILHIVGRV